jgi:hypothetical protein
VRVALFIARILITAVVSISIVLYGWPGFGLVFGALVLGGIQVLLSDEVTR